MSFEWPDVVILEGAPYKVSSSLIGFHDPEEIQSFLEEKRIKEVGKPIPGRTLLELDPGFEAHPILKWLVENYGERVYPVLESEGHIALSTSIVLVKLLGSTTEEEDKNLLGKYGLTLVKKKEKRLTAEAPGGPLQALLLCPEIFREKNVTWAVPDLLTSVNRGE